METQTKEIAEQKPKNEGVKTTGGQLARLSPQSFGELEHMAAVLSKSDIVPRELIGKPANILLVLMFGNEIGLTAAQSLQNVMVVNGRPSLWGDAVMGLVLSHPAYEDSKDSFDEKTMTATFSSKRKGKDWLVRSFAQADAEKAGLWKKAGPWTQYPKRMLFHRARSWALRDSFADALKGLRYYEEERDIINLERSQGNGPTYELPKEKIEAVVPAVIVTETKPEQTELVDRQKTDEGMNVVTIVVTDLQQKSGEGKKGPWTRWSVKDQEGGVYSTFDAEVGAFLAEAKKCNKRVTLECETTEDGKYNNIVVARPA